MNVEEFDELMDVDISIQEKVLVALKALRDAGVNPHTLTGWWTSLEGYERDALLDGMVSGRSLGWAVDRLWEGEKVRREGWNGKGMWLYMIHHAKWGDRIRLLGGTPFIVINGTDSLVRPWTCSQADMIATDWELVVG